MLNWIYKCLKHCSRWFNPKLLTSLRSFGNKLSELGIEDDILKFYRAVNDKHVSEANYLFDQMMIKVSGTIGNPSSLSYLDSQLIKAYTDLQNLIYHQNVVLEKKKSFEEVTKYLESNIIEACGQNDFNNPDEEPTEIILPINFMTITLH